MDLHVWLICLLAAIGLSLSPGPNGLLALTHGALHGRQSAFFTVLGGCVGFVTVIPFPCSVSARCSRRRWFG
jgi:homoserine/homoserine lactone efflux protein